LDPYIFLWNRVNRALAASYRPLATAAAVDKLFVRSPHCRADLTRGRYARRSALNRPNG